MLFMRVDMDWIPSNCRSSWCKKVDLGCSYGNRFATTMAVMACHGSIWGPLLYLDVYRNQVAILTRLMFIHGYETDQELKVLWFVMITQIQRLGWAPKYIHALILYIIYESCMNTVDKNTNHYLSQSSLSGLHGLIQNLGWMLLGLSRVHAIWVWMAASCMRPWSPI